MNLSECPVGHENAYYENETQRYYCPDCDNYLSEESTDSEDLDPTCLKCGNTNIVWDEESETWYCSECDQYYNDDNIDYT